MIKSENHLTNKYKNLISNKTSNQFNLIGEFDEDFITMKCNTCKEILKVPTREFLKNFTCFNSKCRKRQKLVNEIEELANDEYTVLKNFCDTDNTSKDYKKCLIKHNNCGLEYKIIPRNFINGRRCPECTKTKFKTPEQYEKDFMMAGNGQFSLLSKYVRATEKVTAQHTGGCNHIFDVTASYFLRDPRCPICEKQTNAQR